MGGLINFDEKTTPKFRSGFSGDINSIERSGLYTLIPGCVGTPNSGVYALLDIFVSDNINGYKIMRWYSKDYKDIYIKWKFETYESGWIRLN
ncbi:hypothetical protein H6A66_10905 [Bacteroides caecigallinarum]|uniref:hypothetical protein n=1 Tax=Bacteroides caecigallinarum TaxID=1411144 RepID=UPI0019576258|nr:hypothetical protein [Bacteroides caecigallinarum]MBM6865671.1 hypothetical protein [Bacteroides caecigallinarum]